MTRIRTVAETGSTNADLLALAPAGLAEGEWLRAERQSAGRGRQGREWVSPPGNLYASTLVRLRPTDPPAPTLALVAAVALAEAVGSVAPGRDLTLKWPNDLLLGAAKMSGVLLERAGEAVVIGFGVNVAHHPSLPDRRTTSLAAHGIATTAADLLAGLAERFAAWLARWHAESPGVVRERWLALAHGAGTPLTARLPDGASIDGVFAGLAQDGALLLDLADGSRRVIHAGDVFAL